MTPPRLIVSRGVIYCETQPCAVFASTLQACAELAALGWRCVCRVGGVLVFEERGFPLDGSTGRG